MSARRIEIRPTGKKLTNMEHTIIEAAKVKILKGADRNYIRLFLEEEIAKWKKLVKYHNTETKLVIRSDWEMALMNGTTELAIFKTVF